MPMTRIAIVVFVVAVVLGPLYTAEGYSPVSNLISELAAQRTPRNYIMAAAFLILGVAILAHGFSALRRPLLPFMAFGLFFGAAGLFGHKPIIPDVPYSPSMHAAHSALATLSGVALTVGFGWQAVEARTRSYRWLCTALAVVCVGMPLLMLQQPHYQGLVQRIMYLLVFAWFWIYYPRRGNA